MLKSYLVVALRNLFRNKLYAAINIIGLGVAIALCVVGFINYQFSQSFNTFHKNAEKIYTVNSFKLQDHNRRNYSYTAMAMGPIIQKDIPGIAKMVRLSESRGTLRYEDRVFNESFLYADEGFFEMFSFPLLMGNKDVLTDKSAIVITREIAEKYFGKENPIGKQMVFSPDGEKIFDFFVRAVVENFPLNSSIQANVITAFANVEPLREFDINSWKHWSRALLIQVSDNASVATIEQKLQEYLPAFNEVNSENWQFAGYYLDYFPKLASNTRDLSGDPFHNGMHPAAIMGPSVTALLVLLLACFNFINTALAFAGRRLKEIGIRKVVGGRRSQLIAQFIGENLILCFIALLFGIVLSFIFVPAYDSLWPEISLTFNLMENIELLGFLATLLMVTGIAAGAYPAFYISGFNPVRIFRGKQKLGGTNLLIRILLVFQFALSITAIIAGILFQNNAEFLETFDRGYDREQIAIIPVKGEQEYSLVKNAIENHPNIVQVAGTRHNIMQSWTSADVEHGESKMRATVFQVGENYFQTQGLNLIDGRWLNHELQTDIDGAVLVNETFVKQFGWNNPIDKSIKAMISETETQYHIAGVVKDYHYNSVWRTIRPVMVQLAPKENYRYLLVRFRSNDILAISEYLESEWKTLFPHVPYDGYFMDKLLAEEAKVNGSIRQVFFYIAIISVLISVMGLFALVSLNIAKRTKEIGIRKVLGASIMHIGQLISKEFVILLVIGSVIATGMGYFMVDALMGSIWDYYVDFGVLPFITAAAMVFLSAILTVSSQVYRVATSNPVDSIREE